jgi:transposase
MAKRKKYTKEFKEEAAKLVIDQGYTQEEASKNLGVAAKNLSRWIQEIKGLKVKKPTPTSDSVEVARLKKEIHRLKLEREILKKAAAFFANEPN